MEKDFLDEGQRVEEKVTLGESFKQPLQSIPSYKSRKAPPLDEENAPV